MHFFISMYVQIQEIFGLNEIITAIVWMISVIITECWGDIQLYIIKQRTVCYDGKIVSFDIGKYSDVKMQAKPSLGSRIDRS